MRINSATAAVMQRVKGWAIPAYIVLCVLLGGASAAGYWANMVLQLLAIAIILWATWRREERSPATAAPGLLWLIASILVLGLIQLLPLPPTLWSVMPGRNHIVDAYGLMGIPLPWLPLSLTPDRSVTALLALLPPTAVFLVVTRLGYGRNRTLAYAIVGVAGLSLLMGIMQVLGGPSSPLYLYSITNRGSATGFFANSNHLATLLFVAIPFIAAIALNKHKRRSASRKRSWAWVVPAALVLMLFIGLLVNGSLAGLALAFFAVAGCGAMVLWHRKAVPLWMPIVALALIVGAIAGSATDTFSNKIAQVAQSHSATTRSVSFANSIDAARAYFPTGSGIGSFVKIYPQFEDPNSVTRVFVNHVHNDYIEIVLDAGLPGLVLLLLFIGWWCRQTIYAWSSKGADDPFARAATIATAAVLAHSFLDYPLRTSAILAIFGACCAIMVRARAAEPPQPTGDRRVSKRHLSAE